MTPDLSETKSEVFVSADLLIPVLQQAQKFHGKARFKGIRIRLFGPERVLRVDATNELGQEFMAVVMPTFANSGGSVHGEPRRCT